MVSTTPRASRARPLCRSTYLTNLELDVGIDQLLVALGEVQNER